jgi:hypothetical protein
VSRPALLVFVCATLLAACGAEPDDPPPVFDVKQPRGEESADFPDAGMSVTHPANWRLRRQEAPEVFELVSGQAVVAAWAYPREEPLPATDAELEGAKDRLVDAIKERDPAFRFKRVVIREVANAAAIAVRGTQTLSRQTLLTTSVHVFKGNVEYVIEAIAPPADYELVDREVLTPLLESVELTGEVTDEDTG